MQLVEGSYDLIIVGAGPTGLFTALLAENLGLSVCVLDKASNALEVGRADALNARTQETFEVAGSLQHLEPIGLKCNTSSTFENGKFTSRQSHWWTSLQNVHRPNFLMIGQADVERVLLSQINSPVKYGTLVEKIEEIEEGDGTEVKVYLHNGVLRAKYLVGADGARSFVRNALQIPFQGTKPEMIWAVLDTFLSTDFPVCPEIITFQHQGQARISWIPRERGMARFYVLLSGQITQTLAEAEIRKFLEPHRIDFLRTEWFSTFDVKERVAQTYFSPKGRIMLAGDAAHVHSVNGGQGLNTGIADAFALAWRLSYAICGYTSVLKSYETERLTSARNVIDVAAQLVRSTLRTAEEYVSLVEKNADYITGVGVKYTPAFPAIQGSAAGVFVPGHRCPDVYLEQFDKGEILTRRRIYSLAKYGKFILLLPRHGRRDYQELLGGKSWAKLIEVWICQRQNSDAEKRGNEELPVTMRTFGDSIIDQDGSFIDVGGEGTIVIRPDMYIGYAGKDPERYLDSFLVV